MERKTNNKHFQKIGKGYRDAAIGYNAFKKYVFRIKSEEEDLSSSDLGDKRKRGRPSSAVNPGNSARTEELIREDR